jgi:MerR family mercuric resistance operon transcriptional regulator
MQIGEVSRQTGVHIETIRYYEREGLIPSPPRSSSGRRQYGPEDIRCLTFVRRCRDLGFTLKEVRGLLGLVDGGYTCSEVREIAHLQQARIQQKISDLQKLDRTLAEMAAQCPGDELPDCPIIDALFAKQDQG